MNKSADFYQSQPRATTGNVIVLPGDIYKTPHNLSKYSQEENHVEGRQNAHSILALPSDSKDNISYDNIQNRAVDPRVVHLQRAQSYMPSQNNNIQHRTIQPSLFAFRQESLRGDRILQIPSSGSIPDINRVQSVLQIPDSEAAAGMAIQEFEIPQVRAIHESHAEHVDGANQQNIEIVVQGNEDNQAQGERQGQGEVEAAQQEAAQPLSDPRIKKTAFHRVLFQFIFNILAIICYALGYAFVENAISVTALFVAFIAITILYIIFIARTGGLSRRPDKFDKWISIGNALSVVIFIVMCYVQTQGSDIPATPFTLFGILLLFATCCKDSMRAPSPSKIILLVEKSILWVQLFLIGLRVDGVGIPWGTIFIPLYFALIILVFSSFLIIFGAIVSFVGIMRQEGTSSMLIIGSMWYILNALYTGVWLALTTQIITQLNQLQDDRDDGITTTTTASYNYIQPALIAGLVHSGILFAYTLIFWKQLCKFQEFEVQSEMLAAPRANQAANAAGTADHPGDAGQVQFSVNKETRLHLVMISPTFYTYLTQHLGGKKDKKQVEDMKSDIEKARLERYKKKLSVNAPTRSADPGTVNIEAFSPAVVVKNNRNLELSANDIDIARQIPAPVNITRTISRQQTNADQCMICFDNWPNAVFMDCGHGGVCYECALANWKKTDHCIMCRAVIKKVLKIVHLKHLNIIKVVESTEKVATQP